MTGASSGNAFRGKTNYHDGLAAEDIVRRFYCDRGASLAASRWRGLTGELDLVFISGDDVIVVEVKKAATFEAAAAALSQRQLGRIMSAAEEFVAARPGGLLTPVRIDLALVDGQGACEIRENISF